MKIIVKFRIITDESNTIRETRIKFTLYPGKPMYLMVNNKASYEVKIQNFEKTPEMWVTIHDSNILYMNSI
jgi:hypothetical protein